VTRLWDGRLEFDSQQEQGRDFFPSPQHPDQLWGLLHTEVKRLERETDRSIQSSSEVKMCGAIPPLFQYVFTA